MKIGYLVTYFHPFIGGTESNCLSLAKAEVKRGNDVSVFTSDRKMGEVLDEREDIYEGIRIKRFKPLLRYRMYFVIYPKLSWAIWRSDLDVIHAHGFGFLWHDFTLVVKKIISPRTRFINTPHQPLVIYETSSLFEKIMKFINRVSEKYLFNWVYDKVIAVNPAQQEWMKDYGIKEDRITIIPNGLNEDDLDYIKRMSKIPRGVIETEFGLEGKFLITYVGRFTYYKGIEDLIDVFDKLSKSYPKLHLALIGRDDGFLAEVRRQIEALGNEKITIYEDITDEEKFKLYRLSEINVLPSQWEAMGIVTLEAMVSKCVAISTNTEGGKYIFEGNNAGLLFDYHDRKTLSQYIERLITDRGYRLKMQQNAYERGLDFTIERIEKKYWNLLKSITT